MRGAKSILTVAGLACALGAGALATRAEPARPPVAPPEAAPVIAPPVETDAQRRARLNARLQDMLRSGEGARLTDAPPRRQASAPSPSPSRPAARHAATPRPSVRPNSDRPSAAVSSAADESWTIAPPAQRAAAAVRTGGYRAPRLDLTTPANVPSDPVECLTQAIYYEARSESEEGQAAVAEVVLNRSRSGRYPADVCQVVYQRNSRTCQFTFTCDGSIGRGAVNMRSWARAERIAREVYEGRSSGLLPAHSVNYHADYVRPTWGRRLEQVRQIGAHVFYGAPLDGGTTPGAEREAPREAPRGGLLFVRNEALDRAYALVMGGSAGEN